MILVDQGIADIQTAGEGSGKIDGNFRETRMGILLLLMQYNRFCNGVEQKKLALQFKLTYTHFNFSSTE